MSDDKKVFVFRHAYKLKTLSKRNINLYLDQLTSLD